VGHLNELPGGSVDYTDLIPEQYRTLDEAALEQALLREGIAFVTVDPVRYLQLSLSRIPVYFKFWPDSASSLLSNIARTGSFGLFLPFMLYGLVLAFPGRNPSRWHVIQDRQGVILLLMFIVVYAAIHLLSWTQIRYRLPVDAVAIIFAALALTTLAARLQSARARSRAEVTARPAL
jgi:hypothetical protein